jgi:hypothetical protein
MNPEQIEKVLTDEDWKVRYTLAHRTDVTLTPEQIVMGLKDKNEDVRQVFEVRQAEWKARREAQELKKRHAQITATHRKVEAL